MGDDRHSFQRQGMHGHDGGLIQRHGANSLHYVVGSYNNYVPGPPYPLLFDPLTTLLVCLSDKATS